MRASSQWEKPVLLTPLVLFLLMMLGFPSLLNIIYSFSAVDFHNLRSPQWQGWQNHAEVLADESFWRALGFSCRFGLITAFIETLLGLALAVYLAPLMGPHRWILAILMLPLMVAPSMMGLMYRLVLHEFVGPLSYYGAMVLENTPSFLGQDWAFTTLVVMEVMQWTPFTLLLLFTAYQSLPQDVREAALVNGTRPWRLFWCIELPQLAPTLLTAVLIRFIDGFRVFDNIYALMGSGPGGSTLSMSIYIYESFFKSAQLGKAMAASVMLFTVAFGLLYALGRWAKREPA